MKLVLLIKNDSYSSPFSINTGCSVACTFSDNMDHHLSRLGKTRRRKLKKKQIAIPK
jgi:hypothetical protein